MDDATCRAVHIDGIEVPNVVTSDISNLTQFEPYLLVPTFQEAISIVQSESCFTHKSQKINGVVIHSFKYKKERVASYKKFPAAINLRGITFAENGDLLALPFPKFFNLGENALASDIDLSAPQYVADKLDGSLISFFRAPSAPSGDQPCELDVKIPDFHPTIRLKTMNCCVSEFVSRASKVLRDNAQRFSALLEFVDLLLESNVSPTFEFIGPENKIVLDYDEMDFVFLGARCMSSGIIVPPRPEFYSGGIPDSITLPKQFLETQLHEEHMKRSDVEGIVLTLQSGQMIKMKTASYMAKHHTFEALGNITLRVVAKAVLNNCVDDMKGILAQRGDNDSKAKLKLIDQLEERLDIEVEKVIAQSNSFHSKTKNLPVQQLYQLLENEDRLVGEVVQQLRKGALTSAADIHDLVHERIVRKHSRGRRRGPERGQIRRLTREMVRALQRQVPVQKLQTSSDEQQLRRLAREMVRELQRQIPVQKLLSSSHEQQLYQLIENEDILVAEIVEQLRKGGRTSAADMQDLVHERVVRKNSHHVRERKHRRIRRLAREMVRTLQRQVPVQKLQTFA